MNKECTIKNQIAIIKDEKGNEREISYCDNLDDILIQENIIETIQNVINDLENSSSSFLKYKLRDILTIPVPILETMFVPSIMMYIVRDLNKSAIEGMIYTRFGLMSREKFLIIFIAVFLPYGLHMTKKWYKEYDENARCEKGRIVTLQELKDNLEIQKNILKEMNKKSKPAKAKTETSYFIDDADKLEILREYISLYYDIGYKFKEYYRYYVVNGDLPESLKQEYNEEGKQIIKKLLKKNGQKHQRN